MTPQTCLLWLLLPVFIPLTPPHPPKLSLSSADLKVEDGARVYVDSKFLGTSPCKVLLSPDIRHIIEARSKGRPDHTFFVTWKSLKKSELFDNIPTWFLGARQSDYPQYRDLAVGTAQGLNLAQTIDQAATNANGKVSSVRTDRYNTVRGSGQRSRLDSISSRSYPQLTRGQMDSVSDVSGGKIVVRSFPEPGLRGLLEIEIQKVGDEYRVYVLSGGRS